MVTPHGRVLEAPTASIFWVDPQGTLVTPPLDDHILASITRDRVMQLVDVEERHTTPDELDDAREAFLASTTREVQSVAGIEGRELPGPGERTLEAAQALRTHISDVARVAARFSGASRGGRRSDRSRTRPRGEPRRLPRTPPESLRSTEDQPPLPRR